MSEDFDDDAVPTAPAPSPVDIEIGAIEKVMQVDSRTYWRDGEMQRKYGELLERREAGEVDVPGVPAVPAVPTTPEFDPAVELGITKHDFAYAQDVALSIDADMTPESQTALNELVGQAPEQVKIALIAEFGNQGEPSQREADATEVAEFGAEFGEKLIAEWGGMAGFNVAAVKARYQRVMNGLDENSQQWLGWLVDNAAPEAIAAVFRNVVTR